jgi:predicted transcriptional regulator
MPASGTLTIRLTPEVKKWLGRVAASTHRTRSFLVAEAIARYVAREAEIVDDIERGLGDMKAGRLLPHDEAMVWCRPGQRRLLSRGRRALLDLTMSYRRLDEQLRSFAERLVRRLSWTRRRL